MLQMADWCESCSQVPLFNKWQPTGPGSCNERKKTVRKRLELHCEAQSESWLQLQLFSGFRLSWGVEIDEELTSSTRNKSDQNASKTQQNCSWFAPVLVLWLLRVVRKSWQHANQTPRVIKSGFYLLAPWRKRCPIDEWLNEVTELLRSAKKHQHCCFAITWPWQ